MASSRLPAATDQWEKTSMPVCYPEKNTGKWRLFLNFTKRKGDKAKRQQSSRFASREAALAGVLDFRTGDAVQPSRQALQAHDERSSPILSSCGGSDCASSRQVALSQVLGKLNAVEERKFKRLRLAGSDATRAGFTLKSTLSRRERCLVARVWSKREGKLRRDFDKRGSYLGNRIYELTSRSESNEQHIRRIEAAMAEQDLASLLAPLPPSPIEGNADVDARACTEGEDNQYKEEVSATQANRLWYQGHSALTVLKEERKRDLRQLELTQQAKALSDEPYTTIPAVKAAEAKRFELLNEASRRPHQSSRLRIAARVNSAGSRVYAASTILGWLRDLRGHGGFKRDSRGVHEWDWIMSEEDLKDELIKWMRTQKRLTVNLPVSMATTHSWMIALGCKYERATKSFYTDGHEKKDVVVYRGKYIDVKRKLALRQPLWVRVQRDTLLPEELQRLDGIKGKVRHIGQDESLYKAYAREGKEWVVQGVRGLRKKTEGPGEMVSAFQDERHGFGLPLTDDVLQAVNARRKEKGKEVLTRSPGLRFLQYGKNKDGYWGYDEFKEQIEDVLDVLDVFEPDMQVVVEIDHSSGHTRQREDGLHVGNMNVKYGGKQKVLRDTVMTEGCLGPEEAKMYLSNGKWSTEFTEGAEVYDMKLKVGDTQTSTFAAGSPPPFYEWDAPRKDVKVARKAKRKSKAGAGVGAGDVAADGAGTKPRDKIKEGYEGKAKGSKQYLWEWGWWKDGMWGSLTRKTSRKSCRH
ncbi:unnamed protein product [Ectocarpus sp. CCAP 1310/34]|nr:unnamed protein product [Ectocarpus sp. CCAP 1310/34]